MKNTYFIDPTFLSSSAIKNTKIISYIQSYPEINMIQLIKFYYNFDISGFGPSSKDPQT